MPENSSLATTLEKISGWLDTRIEKLEELGSEMLAEISLDSKGYIDANEALRRRLKQIAVKYLAEESVVDGCGLIFAHSAIGKSIGHLEWWVREDESRFARYSFGVVPGADRYYDYEQHEWFVRAYYESAPSLVGPYIDYLGVETYVLTLTLPAVIQGKRVGAVGNDIQLEDLEQELLPILLACDQEVTILNRHQSVLLSNTSKYLPGQLVTEIPAGFELSKVGKDSSELQLLHEKN